jgi:L-ascorbate metabolism protein UlaG (beta-lactamase superfamily)
MKYNIRLIKQLSLCFLLIQLCLLTNSCHRIASGADTYTMKDGKKLIITPIKHASVEMNYNGLEFEIDPVASNVRPIVEYFDKPKADYILVTHKHDDHFDKSGILTLTDGTKTQILMDISSWNRYYHKGMHISNGQKAILGNGITIYAVPAYNITKKYRKVHQKGIGNGYVIDFNGFRVYIAGDTELIPEMKQLKHIDIAFLPCNQPYTMTLKQLREAVLLIRPKVVYPYNWGKTKPEAIKKALRGVPSEVKMKYFK